MQHVIRPQSHLHSAQSSTVQKASKPLLRYFRRVVQFYVKQINFDSRRVSMTASLNFTVSQVTAATQLRRASTKTNFLENLPAKNQSKVMA